MMYDLEDCERFSKNETVDFIKSDGIDYKEYSIGEDKFDEANSRNTEESIDEIAYKNGLIPMDLKRDSCTADNENILRKLGRVPSGDFPWIPVGSLGPLIIIAHHDPLNEDSWGIPDILCVKTVINRDKYHCLLDDLLSRLDHNPLSAISPLDGFNLPAAGQNPISIIEWFIDNYPLSLDDKQKWNNLIRENEGNEILGPKDYKGLPRHYGVAFFKLFKNIQCFNPEEAPPQSLFPEQLLEKHVVYPIHNSDSFLYLLSESPNIYKFEDEWLSEGHDPIEIIPILADADSIRSAITKNRGITFKSSGPLEAGELHYSEDQNLLEIDPVEIVNINPLNPNVSPEEVIKWILFKAISERGSDLHIEKYFNTSRFRARVDGSLKTIHSCSEEQLPRFIALLKNYSNMSHQHQNLQDARFGMKIGRKRIDVRVSAMPCRKENQKLTMRFLDKQDGIKELSELNLSDRQSGVVSSTMNRDQGLVLVTGPTGSGKTTSLYAFINSINSDDINIHTIEDPIEYEIEGINQTQTDEFHGIDFATGLRGLLRADPDVILVGESRDEETATAAINSALTGHLVLTTLHANDSLRAISRLISMGVEPYLLGDALAMSQAQRLVKKLCGYCKRAISVNDRVQELFYRNGVIKEPTNNPIFMAEGCEECNGTGFLGRVAIMEMCSVDQTIAEMVSSGASMAEMRKEAAKQGVLSLYQEGLNQVILGNTTLEEIAKLSHFGSMS